LSWFQLTVGGEAVFALVPYTVCAVLIPAAVAVPYYMQQSYLDEIEGEINLATKLCQAIQEKSVEKKQAILNVAA
jgi:hypothetical protein